MTTSAFRTLITPDIMSPTQNTAPVLEYRCLHTSDIRRKQKRWQDGRVKFHTFNNRIMVYDDQGNFVGDTHWYEDYEFEEGLEVKLERSGILVQVSECMGKRSQDLTELWDKRQKQREEKSIKGMAISSPLVPSESGIRTQAYISPHSNMLQRVSTKRRRLDVSPPMKSGYAQNLTGATLTLSGRPPSTAALCYDPLSKGTFRKPTEGVDSSRQCSTTASKMSLMKGTVYEQKERRRTTTEAARSLQEPYGAIPARNLTGVALMLKERVVNNSAFKFESTSNKTCSSTLGEAAMQDDGFRDIDVYNTNIVQSSPKLEISQYGIIDKGQATLSAENSQSLPHRTLVQSTDGELSRCKKPPNPLRIRARPKRKLLLVTRTQPYQSTTKKDVQLRNDTNVDLPVLQEESEHLPYGGKACNGFPALQEQQRSAQPNMDPALLTTEHFPSETDRLDHHLINALLSRKPCEGLGRIGGNPSKNRSATELSSAPSVVKKSSDRLSKAGQDPLDFNDGVAERLPGLHVREAQVNVHQDVQEVLMARDNDNNKGQIRVCVKAEMSQEPMKIGSDNEIPGSKDCLMANTNSNAAISKSAHQPTGKPILKMVAVLQNPQIKPSNTSAINKNAALHKDVTGRLSEPFVRHARSTGEPVTQVSTMQSLHKNIDKVREEQGPWSREAFDLFDWRPEVKSTANVSAAS